MLFFVEEGTSFSACETWFNSEFLSDPLHIYQNNHQPLSSAGNAWIAGHGCLDDDVITNRLIAFAPTYQSQVIY